MPPAALGAGRSVVLSFDDGPAPEIALQQILATLAREGITAEFYVIGSEVEKYPEAARSIVRAGHRLQNHSWSHPDLAKAPASVVLSELSKTQAIVQSTTNTKPTKVRPPFGAGGWPGKYDPELASVARQLGLTIQNWDVDTEDWRKPQGLGPTKRAAIRDQFSRQPAKKVFQILMHVQPATARDLPEFIAALREWGFAFAKPGDVQ